MQPVTAIIPYRSGAATLPALLASLPADWPVIVIDDVSGEPLQLNRANTRVIRLKERGYFSGAVNAGIAASQGDVLVLNQDVTLTGNAWQEWLAQAQLGTSGKGTGIAGHAQMRHPHWPKGYVQGQFMWLDRRALDEVGPLNARDYPLWGATAELQLRLVRRGWKALPVAEIPGMAHARPRGEAFGSSIQQLLAERPERRDWFIRTPPAVSVIVTSHSYGRYLTDAIHSLIGGPTSLGQAPGQTFQSFEVIIVDDGSNDETAEVGQALADDWKAIRYIRRDTQGGTPAANNTGIRAAHGKFITILCGDDMREPWGLESLYRVVEKDPRAVPYDDMTIVAGGARGKGWPMSEFSFERILVRNMMHAGVMFARRGWEQAGGYPEVMKDGREDWAFNVALGQVGYCGVHVPKAGYLYRREGQNRSLTNQGADWREHFVEQMHDLFPRLYSGERPMSCCGGSNVVSRNGTGETLQLNGEEIPLGADGMTLLEYLGGNSGTETWYGAVTQGRYLFGGSRTKGWVDNRDVPGFLKAFENRRHTFRAAVMAAAPAPAAPQPEPELVTETELAQVAGGEAPSDSAPSEETGPIGPEGLALRALAARFSYPISTQPGEWVEGDPRELTVAQVKDVLPSAGKPQLERMLAMENESGRARKSVVKLIQDALDA